jgi:hypothetical protein
MPAIVYHIGIFDNRKEPDYAKFVIKSQMSVLHTFCKSADIYLGLHADQSQVDMILDLANQVGLKIKDTMSYQNDLWEVPTVEWLQNVIAPKYEKDDYISYVHSKGITYHDDQCRNYIMDHLFVNYEDNLKYLKSEPTLNAAVLCTHVDIHLRSPGFYYSCWTAKISHVQSIPPPDRTEKRWASEWFLKLKLGEFWPVDNRMCIHKPGAIETSIVPGEYMYGDVWKPSENLKALLKPIHTEFNYIQRSTSRPTYDKPIVKSIDKPKIDKPKIDKPTQPIPHILHHIIYASVIVVLLGILLGILLASKPPSTQHG